MASRPPTKKPPKLDVSASSYRIDDPTAAFPIGALNDPESLDDDAVSPVSPTPAKVTPKKAERQKGRSEPSVQRTVRPPVVAGVDLRWLAVSLAAGAALAVVVVAVFGLLVLLVR